MNIAIPVQGLGLANHFTKANSFAIYDQQGALIAQFENPAINGGCEGKSQLVEMLNQNHVGEVVVKNIGERMLGKLLGSNMSVRHVNMRGAAFQNLLSQLDQFPKLTDVSQARKSVNYEKKQANGGCCNHEHGEHHHGESKSSCCGHQHGDHHVSEHHHGRCCQR